MTSEAHEVQLPGSAEGLGHGRNHRSAMRPYHKIAAHIIGGYINLLLICVPLGVAAGVMGWSTAVVFSLNLVAIVPLTAWITFAIGELAPVTGRMGDELLKATIGNPVEVLVGLIALRQGHIPVVQRVLIGSVLLNSLLVLGSCIFLVGCHKMRVLFERKATSIMSSLTVVATMSLIVPTTMSKFPPTNDDGSLVGDKNDILRVSHGAAALLFVMSILFTYFQLNTHAELFHVNSAQQLVLDEGDPDSRTNNYEHEGLSLNPWIAGFVLMTGTIAQAVCVSFMVQNIQETAGTIGISAAFLVTVLVPLVGNAYRSVIIVTTAKRGPINLALRAIIGTNLRILILIMPVLVLVGWTLDQPLTLRFDLFDATILFLTIMVMNYLIQDGRSNYFEGLVLIGTYVIIAVAFDVRPQPPDDVIYL